MNDSRKLLVIGLLATAALLAVSILGTLNAATGFATFSPAFGRIESLLQNPPPVLDFTLFFALFMSITWISFSNVFKINERTDLKAAVIVMCTVVSLIFTVGLLYNPVYPVTIANLGPYFIV